MLTRNKSKASKRQIEDIPLPARRKSSKRTHKKVKVSDVEAKDNIEIAPIIELPQKYVSTEQQFLRKAFIHEPTDAEYEKVSKIWNHIWNYTNVCVEISGKATGFSRTNKSLLLIRDHRGGSPSDVLLTDPHNTYIQAFECRFGFLERCVMDYFNEETYEKAMTRLKNVGWLDPDGYEPESMYQQVFY